MAAQEALDSWAQGLLALQRLRNLSARAVAQEDAESLLFLRGSAPVEDVSQLELVLRLNVAQALLKLRLGSSSLCK